MLDKHYGEKRTKLLIDIVSQNNKKLDEQLYYALESTCELLGLEIGIISSIWANKYIVEHFSPEGVDLYKGQNFELGNTYCSITLESEGVFSVANMKKSEYNMHPCYNAFQLEAYIGVPIMVDGKLYGTINFSSSKPKKEGFSKADHDLIILLGEWAGGVIYRKNLEENLISEKEAYEVLSKNSSELICLHKPDGTYTFVSESSIEILGYSADELINTSPYDLIHPDDIEQRAQLNHKKVMEGTPVGDIEYRMRQKNGDYIWVHASAEPVINSMGEVTAIQTTSRDITESKRTEFMLNESQKMASVGGWEFDVDSGKLYWTEEVYRIHDKEIGAEIMVDEGLSYFEGESKALVEKALQKTIETGESYDLQLRFTSAKGVKKWVRAIGYASLVDGKVKKLRGTFQDITKQVEAEQKIIEQNKRLEKNDEEKEKLYSIIAHDLRGGFNGIIGLLEVLKEDFESLDLEEEYWYKLKLAINSARNANQLMENLLKWIKAQNTFMPSNNKLVNISSLIVDCESFVKPSLIKKNIEIVNEVGDIEVHGDQDMLGTVFRNLISNAVKFSRTESQIVIKGKKIDSNTAEFRIKDFGIGMSADVIENLFNKSYRPKRLGTSKEKGTGLGLILCNELIELHGGTIKVQSEEGSGSEFIVLLPLNEAEV